MLALHDIKRQKDREKQRERDLSTAALFVKLPSTDEDHGLEPGYFCMLTYMLKWVYHYPAPFYIILNVSMKKILNFKTIF